MEKKIIFSETMPDKKFLWLHTKNHNLVLEVFGNKGWEAIGDDSITYRINKLAKENQELRKQLKAQVPIQVKLPKLTENCSKKELLSTIEKLKNVLIKIGIIEIG